MQVNTSQAAQAIGTYLQAGLVPMLQGSPGIGKSSIYKQVAEDYNLEVIDIRLSQTDPTELNGFPTIIDSDGSKRAAYIPMDIFPLEGAEVPKGKDGWLLFLDECNGAPKATQLAAYKLILDRMVGNHKLHPKVAIAAAGNLDTDNAVTEEMSTAIQSRMVHLELQADLEAWLDWAAANGIDSRIRSYLSFRTQNLYTFSPTHTDRTYACPRTWEFASRVLNKMDINDPLALTILSGVISQPIALEFLEFCRLNLPKMKDIMDNPGGYPMPWEPNILYALSGALGDYINKENVDELYKFVSRMPIEFQQLALREAVRRDTTITQQPSIRKWAETVGHLLK